MLEKLNVASFKGVRFPCNETTTTAGRAKIKHEFANSNKNNIEDQGGIPRVYQLTAIITGEDYEIQRDKLLKAIESAGAGVLIHPFYGRVENVVAMPVTYSESMRRLGRVEIPITFEISDSEGIPAVTQRSSSNISNLKDSLITATTDDFANKYEVTNSFTGNFQAAQEKTAEFAGAVSEAVTLRTAGNKVAEYRAALDTFSRNINTITGSPSALASSVTALVNGISQLYDTAEETIDSVRRLTNFGTTDADSVATTAGLIERKRNNRAFNDAVQATALGVSYESATLAEYRTVEDIDTVSRSLEAVYARLKSSDMNQASLNALDEIRTATNQLLSEQKLSAASIVQVETVSRPVRLLSFDYYGESARAEELIGINGDVNTSYYEGEVGVLTK